MDKEAGDDLVSIQNGSGQGFFYGFILRGLAEIRQTKLKFVKFFTDQRMCNVFFGHLIRLCVAGTNDATWTEVSGEKSTTSSWLPLSFTISLSHTNLGFQIPHPCSEIHQLLWVTTLKRSVDRLVNVTVGWLRRKERKYTIIIRSGGSIWKEQTGHVLLLQMDRNQLYSVIPLFCNVAQQQSEWNVFSSRVTVHISPHWNCMPTDWHVDGTMLSYTWRKWNCSWYKPWWQYVAGDNDVYIRTLVGLGQTIFYQEGYSPSSTWTAASERASNEPALTSSFPSKDSSEVAPDLTRAPSAFGLPPSRACRSCDGVGGCCSSSSVLSVVWTTSLTMGSAQKLNFTIQGHSFRAGTLILMKTCLSKRICRKWEFYPLFEIQTTAYIDFLSFIFRRVDSTACPGSVARLHHLSL